jgi:hypothetical protein
MRQRANTQDPNYGAIFRPGEKAPLNPKRPLAMGGPKSNLNDEYPGFKEFVDAVLNEMAGFDVASQVTAHETATIPASVINSTRLQAKDLMDQAAQLPTGKNTTIVPKNSTTASKL